jgi:serine/threonine-protein kinase PknG
MSVDAGTGTACLVPDCGGTLDEGYCDTCGRPPSPIVAAPVAPASLAARRPAATTAPSSAQAQASAQAHAPAPTHRPDPDSAPLSSPTSGSSSSASASTGSKGRLPVLAPVDGQLCGFDGCGGLIEAGYCDNCGRAPVGQPLGGLPLPTLRPQTPRARSGTHGSRRTTTDSTRTDSTSSRRTGTGSTASRGSRGSRSTSGRTGLHRGNRLGMGIVDVPPVPTGDPSLAVMANAEVPESKRFCSGCNQPVGRARSDRSGRTDGFCPSCRTHFSFTPKLAPGDLVAGQYEVLGALSHGGLGWIHLARDRAVSDRWVVLKGLLDTTSEDAAMAAVAERRFLAALNHPNVVQIYNFVAHQGAGYIVMEYVGGKSLKQVLKERRESNGGRIDPLPVDRAVAYALAVLPALGYLHNHGLVYCDMKPDNIVLTGDGLKIIDLGGVRHVDDDEGAIYGTTGYQAPEVSAEGPSPASDLYTVGRMLAVLVLDFRGYQGTYVDRLPPATEHPLLAAHESLHRFLLKATAPDPAERFDSADEMAEQLLGVLREEAGRRGHPQPAVSRLFTPDAVVGAGPDDQVPADWHLLPQPRLDAADPGVGYLLGLADGDAGATVTALASALATHTVPTTPETLLRLARAQLDAGDPEAAGLTLDELADEDDWRVWWQQGLRALAENDPVDAIGWLDPVYTELPGEVPAKLALALAYELAGDLPRSGDLYDIASRTDPSYVSGAFGLARVRVAAGDREGAVEALDRVPAASSAHVMSRVATVRALAAHAPDQAPTADQLELASTVLDMLHLDPRRHALLARELYDAALAALARGTDPAGRRMLGRPLEESALREGLEATYRQLARQATTSRERVELVDQANRVRARTLL